MNRLPVVYYTWSWNNTERVAGRIAAKLDADLFRIDTVEPYPRVEDLVVAQAKDEVFGKSTPPIKPLDFDLDDYDTVIVGCPVWWLSMAPAMRTFLTENAPALEGKNVACFTTRASWPGTELADMESLLANSTLLPSFECVFGAERAYEMVTPVEELDSWIEAVRVAMLGQTDTDGTPKSH